VIGLTPWEVAEVQAAVAELLADRCTITRPTGRGSSAHDDTVATAVPYCQDDSTRARFAAMAGGFQSVNPGLLYVLPGTDVQAKDTITDDADSQTWTVDGVDDMTNEAVRVVFVTRQGS
jgi:hypothetical protein